MSLYYLSINRSELYRFVLKRVQDEADAEDLLHDVLVKAYARREMLKEPSKLRSWLFQITRNMIVDYYRSRRPTQEVPDDRVREDTGEEHGHAQEELARCLVPLLDELPNSYGQAVRMTEFEGATQREVALQLGLSLSGAKSRVQRGRRMLREALLECCRVELDRRGGVVDYDVRDGCEVCEGPTRT